MDSNIPQSFQGSLNVPSQPQADSQADVTNSTTSPPNFSTISITPAQPPVVTPSPSPSTPSLPTSPSTSYSIVSSPELQAMTLLRNLFDLTAAYKLLKNDIQQNKRQISQLLEAQTRLEIDNRQLREQLAHSTGEIFRLTRALDFKSAELHERGTDKVPSHETKSSTSYSSPSASLSSSSSYSISHPLVGSFSLQLEYFALRVMLSFLDFKIITSGKLDTSTSITSTPSPYSPSILLGIYFLISSALGLLLLVINQIFLDLGIAFFGYMLLFNGFLFAIVSSLINKYKQAPLICTVTVLLTVFLFYFGFVNSWTAAGSLLYGAVTLGVIMSKESNFSSSSSDDLSKIV